MHRALTSVVWFAVALAAFFLGYGLRGVSGTGSEPVKASAEAAGKAPGSPIREPVALSERAARRGKWRVRREAAEVSPPEEAGPEDDKAAALMALPYLQGYRGAEGEPTIATYVVGRVQPGVNLYLSGHGPEAALMDLDGRVLHRWRVELREIWPDLYPDDRIRKLEYWRRAHLLDNGDLLAIFEGLGLIKVDRDSNLLWARRGGYHHDLEVVGETIWILDREGRMVPRVHADKAVLEDFVTLLDWEGRVLRRISLLECFERSVYAPLLKRMPEAGDIFHTNTLEVLDGRLADRLPAFRAGHLLVSVLELDTVAVIDPGRETVVWVLSGISHKQHQPTLLGNGNLMIFDNLGPVRRGLPRRSRILELDPGTQEVLWQYGGVAEVDFFSQTLGSSQRLANGNTLITESENGRALEVTREGEVVWEFYNPHRAGEDDELIAVLFEVLRLDSETPFLRSVTGAVGRQEGGA